MFIQITHFSKQQTTILKGLGILLIVFHNFFHNLTPVIGENEFSFSANILQSVKFAENEAGIISKFKHYS